MATLFAAALGLDEGAHPHAPLTEEDRADRLAALSLYLAHALEQLRAAATKYLEAPVVVP